MHTVRKISPQQRKPMTALSKKKMRGFKARRSLNASANQYPPSFVQMIGNMDNQIPSL